MIEVMAKVIDGQVVVRVAESGVYFVKVVMSLSRAEEVAVICDAGAFLIRKAIAEAR